MINSDEFSPKLSDLGKVAQSVLKLIDGDHNTLNIIESVLENYSELFKDYKTAEEYVKSLIKKYA